MYVHDADVGSLQVRLCNCTKETLEVEGATMGAQAVDKMIESQQRGDIWVVQSEYAMGYYNLRLLGGKELLQAVSEYHMTPAF